MSEPDVVAELNHWLTQWEVLEDAEGKRIVLPYSNVMLRARDEIISLWEKLEYTTVLLGRADVHIRDETLEEAATVCQARFKCPLDIEALNCARAIRALKEKGNA